MPVGSSVVVIGDPPLAGNHAMEVAKERAPIGGASQATCLVVLNC